ncbi:hypothetical protein SAMN04324257_00225 [Thermoanaerobacter thermohydrosulfuricus]|nr:hypothetical protein SAMN04324257_00225 [Thermoanaerobacter thermohydrosulfuricus]
MKKNLFQRIRMNKLNIFLLILFLFLIIPVLAFADSTFIDRILASPFNGLIGAAKKLGFKTIDELVFYLPNTATAPFTQDEWNIAMKWYHAVEVATGGLAVVSMIVAGMRLMAAGANPAKRADAMQKMGLTVLAYAVIWFLPVLSQLVFMGNAYLTELFKNLLSAYGGGALKQTGWGFIESIQTDNILTTAILKCAFVGLMIYFNILYTIRKFILISMLVVVPIAVWGWGISGYSGGLSLVVSEIVSNAFMQSSHALVLSLYAVLVSPGVSSDFSLWWAQLFGLVALIPTAAVLRQLFMGFLRWLGVNEEFYAGLAMSGLAGMASIISLAGKGFSRRRSTAFQSTKERRRGDSPGSNGGGGGSSGGGNSSFGGQEAEAETPALFSYRRGSEIYSTVPEAPLPAREDISNAGAYPATVSARKLLRRDVPGERYQKTLSAGEKARDILSGTGYALGSVVGGAMGLALGGGAVRDFGAIGGGLGGAAGAAGGNLLGTIGGFGSQTLSYKYATDDPNKLYVDEKGNGLIKGVKLEDGTLKYYMPDDEGYADIQPAATFKTEVEAQEHGYTPYRKAGLGDRIKNITGSKHAFDGAGKIAGTIILSPLGTKAAKAGGKAGEAVAKGMRTGVQKGYEWIKNISKNPDNFRWK